MWVERIRLFSNGMLIFPVADDGERLSRVRNRSIYYISLEGLDVSEGCPDELVLKRGLIGRECREGHPRTGRVLELELLELERLNARRSNIAR